MHFPLECPTCNNEVDSVLPDDAFDAALSKEPYQCPHCGVYFKVKYDMTYDSDSGEENEWFETVAEN